jgi:hypothetical protein
LARRTRFRQSLIDSVGPPSIKPPYAYSVTGFDPNMRSPYALEWNIAVQQNLGEKQTFTLTYLGSGGRQLVLPLPSSPQVVGNPNFAPGVGLTVYTNRASSSYNALQAQYERRLSKGLQALVSYNWSHSIDDASSNITSGFLYNGNSDYDVRNNLQGAITYTIPGKYQNRFVNTALAQWSFDTRVMARSALPLNIYAGTTKAYYDSYGVYLQFFPNLVAGEPLYVPGGPGGRTINAKAFALATNSAGIPIDGDFGRNVARAFDAIEADIALRKEFKITERLGLQFRVEAFNILNHPIYGDITTSTTSPQFGRATDTLNTQLQGIYNGGSMSGLYQQGGPRSLQLAARLRF